MKLGYHLVTGGAGMIGSHLSKRLLENGNEVFALDNLMSGSMRNINELIKEYPKRFHFIKADLRDPKVAMKYTNGMDYVWALAANMGGIMAITSVHAAIIHDNAIINLNTLEAAKQNKVQNYFYSSSACAYPDYKQTDANVIPLKESDAYPAAPDQSYGWEKLFTEQACLAYIKDYGMKIHIGRFHNVYGACATAYDSFKGKAPAHLVIKTIKHPNPIFTVWGDGKATRSFLYIDDCIDCLLLLMNSEVYEPLNIGTDHLVTVDELARLIIKASGKNIPKIEHDLTKPQGVRGRNASLELVTQKLGWRPQIPLDYGLKVLYEWAVENYEILEGVE